MVEQLQPVSTAADDDADDAMSAPERDRRESMLLMASVIVVGETAAPTALRVRNLSAGGLMAECDRSFASGERVEIDLRNIGPVLGTVAWARPSRIGVRFDRAIDPKVARKPVGTGAGTSRMIVGQNGRRPGFRP